MINIIREGYNRKPTIKIYTLECQSCHCVFECDYRDFIWQTKTLKFNAAISCPHCGAEILLDEDTPSRTEFLELNENS